MAISYPMPPAPTPAPDPESPTRVPRIRPITAMPRRARAVALHLGGGRGPPQGRRRRRRGPGTGGVPRGGRPPPPRCVRVAIADPSLDPGPPGVVLHGEAANEELSVNANLQTATAVGR